MSERTFDGAMEPSDGEMEVAANVPCVCPTNDDGTEAERGKDSHEQDPFAGSAEDIAADETRRKIELFAWADGVLELNESDLELALQNAVKRFKMARGALRRIIDARRSEKARAKAEHNRTGPDDRKDNVKYYSPD